MKNEWQNPPDNTAHPGVNESHDALMVDIVAAAAAGDRARILELAGKLVGASGNGSPRVESDQHTCYDDELLSLSDVRAYCHIGRTTLWRWENEHALRVITVVGTKLVRRRDLNKFLDRHCPE